MELKRCSKKTQVILAQLVMGVQRSEFHVVDLEAGEVLKTEIQPLLNDGYGNLVRLGPVIYDIGGHTPSEEGKPINPDVIYGDYHIHLGASCLELTIPQRGADDDAPKIGSNKWKDFPLMSTTRVCPASSSLGGKVYVFGTASQETCIGEVFDPRLGRWEPLPPPPDICLDSVFVSIPALSDEKNNRLLVHFAETDSDSLYAYYPNMGIWECLVHDIGQWGMPAAILIDDVLYFHIPEERDCLVAFDLLSKAWLKVNYSSSFPVDIVYTEWEGMLHLGDGMLCLANYCPIDNYANTKLQFVKLRVQRTSSAEVLVTFDSTMCFPFKGRFRANRFILL